MAGNKTSVIETIIKFRTEGTSKLRKKIQETTDATGKLQKEVVNTQKKTGKGWQTTEKRVRDYARAQEQAMQRTQAMFGKLRNLGMGIGFSFLFTGMAVKNFFQGIARSMMNTFQITQSETASFNQSVSRLQGAWEFLKYSIMDALEQTGVLDWVIGAILSLINWFNRLSPMWKSVIGVGIIAMIALGTAAMIVGQAVLAILGPLAILEFLIVSVGRRGMIAFLTALGPMLAWAVIIGAIIALFLTIKTIWTNVVEAFKIRIEQLVNAFETFWTVAKFVWDNIKIGAEAAALYFKDAFYSVIEAVGDKLAGFMNKLVSVYNSIAEFFGKDTIDANFSGINIDRSRIQADLEWLQFKQRKLAERYTEDMGFLSLNSENLQARLQLNLEDALSKLTVGNVLSEGADMIGIPGQGSLADLLGLGSSNKNTTNNNNFQLVMDGTNLMNPASGTNPLSDLDSFAEALMSKFEEMMAKTNGSTQSS